MAMTTARGLLVALAPILVATANVAAAAPSASDKDRAAGPAEKVRQALNAPVNFKAEKQSLTAAIEMLKEKGKVNLVLDTVSMQQLGWLPDHPPTPVDVDLKDVKLKTALRTVLEPYGLSFAVVGDTVVVATEQMAARRQLQQRVSLTLDKVELAQAFKQLRADTGVSLVLDSRVEEEAKNAVSLELEDVTLETAVRLLSEMAGLKPVRIDDVLFVTKKEINKDGVPLVEVRPDPGNLENYRNQVGMSFYFKVTGAATGPVYGTDVYTSDSLLATAAVHAGVLKVGEKGVVKVTMVTVEPFYKSTTRNGVTSSGWNGPWYGAYRIEATKD